MKRILATLSLCVVAGMTLTACDRFGDGPTGVREAASGGMEIAACVPFTVTHVNVGAAPWGASSLTPYDFVASLPIALRRNESIVVPSSSFSPAPPVALQSGDVLSITLTDPTNPDQGSLIGDFRVPEGGLPRDGWLHPDGTVSSSPCADKWSDVPATTGSIAP